MLGLTEAAQNITYILHAFVFSIILAIFSRVSDAAGLLQHLVLIQCLSSKP